MDASVTPEQVPAAKWSHNKGRWVPVVVRVTGYCLECRDATKGSVIWSMDYASLGTPAISLLSSGAPGSPGGLPPGIISSSSGGGGVFSVDARPTFRRPKVLACGARGSLITGMQKAAAQRLGLSLLVDTSQQHRTGADVLNALQQTEQQLASSVHEMAAGEWEVQRLRPCHQIGAALFLLAAPHLGARPAMPVPSFLTPSSPKAQVARRLAVTKGSLIERHAHNYQAVARRPLTALASLARFEEDPKLLGVEWTDGAPPSLYLSPARDEVLAALLDAAQNVLGRPVAVLPGLKHRGDGLIMGRGSEVEVQRWAQEELAGRAKEVYPTLVHSSRMLFTVNASHDASSSKPQPIPGPRTSDGSGAAGAPSDGSLHSGALPATHGSPRSPTQPGLGDLRGSESHWAAAPHSPASSTASHTGDTDGKTLLAPSPQAPQDTPAVTEAVSLLVDTVYDFCACVPQSGVPLFTRIDGQVAASLVALLPMELHQGMAPPVCMPVDEVKQTIMVLQCLQRLCSAPECMDTILALPNIASRLWAVYACGNEAVAAEVAKLLLRWWSPHTSRRGTVPWKASPPGPPGTDIISEPSAEELSLSKAAKALSFQQKVLPERCKQFLAPLKRAAPNTAAGAGGLADARFAGMANSGSVPNASGDVGAAASSVPCSPLLSMAVVEAAAAVAVVPCSATTSPRLLQELLAEAAALGRPLFALFHHPAGRVADGASLLMREIAYSGASAAAPMRHAALREGAFLFHLLRAVDDADARAAALHASELAALQPHTLSPNSAASSASGLGGWMGDGFGAGSGAEVGVGPSAAAALSRELVASWADQYAPALALLKRVLPPGLIRCLNAPQAAAAAPPAAPSPQPATAPTGVAASGGVVGGTNNTASPGVHAQVPFTHDTFPSLRSRKSRRQRLLHQTGVAPGGAACLDLLLSAHLHFSPVSACAGPFVSSCKTRGSRRQQLLHQTVEGRPLVVLSAWNFSEFEVVYPSLQQHLCVGGIYVRLLLDGADSAAVSKLPQPRELFNSLYHHLLASDSHLLAATTQPDTQQGRGLQHTSFLGPMALAAEGRGANSSHTTEEMQILCIRAMAAVYHAHAGAVGPCEGLDHLLRILDHTTRRPVRHQLLLLMAAVLQPKSGQQSQQVQRVARANGYAVHNAGGTELLVDMAAAAHECTESTTASGGASLATTAKPHALDSAGFAAQAPASVPGSALGTAADGGFVSGLASAGAGGLGGLGGGDRMGVAGGTGASPQLLTAKPHAEAQEGSVCEWYCYLPPHLVGDAPVAVQASTDSPAANAVPHTGASNAASGTVGNADAVAGTGTSKPTPPPCPPPPPGVAAVGPLSKPDLARLFLAGRVGLHTPCWADGQGGAGGALPVPLASIRELRWFLSSGPPVLTTHDAARTALHLLHTLATLLPATEADENGVETVVECVCVCVCVCVSPRCLPRLSQVLLTFDPELVPSVASLLELVLRHNEERLSRLYSTGAFYFALAYPGSNLVEIARLLQLTHLRQAPRLNLGAAYSSASLAHRSYLGHVLPESLIYCLDTYGPEVFASVLRGNNDTPELLWTHAMRYGRLLPQLSQHLGNLRR
ncbi:hypothetical protein DUNSADRAFT_2280 [Dunaliella salina]|uniref:DnaJ homologue subfamily C GRV2/DNAJC13 N-terminal domain-containing protein n=1 Tax=Dunaliella salina TaxID=3046 RepID=A0ABQ7GVU3_DUNSA|nr:hypothetical protein DUNSADRAFT_2280 [Dunaliella salina]|eukprot:KAF5838736.1 hypothetical protein DUNSADRAFT_2280 [Dunaliella salina]